MSRFDEQGHPRGADGRWVAKTPAQPATALPNPTGERFTSRNDAIKAVERIVAEADHTLDGRDPAEAYDLDTIADDVLTTEGEGHRYRYVLPETQEGAFWDSLARHAR